MGKTLAFAKSAVLGLALLCAASTTASTPIQQALELEEDVKNVMAALKEVNQPADTFKQAPGKIRGLTRIGDLFDGIYDGPVVFNSESMPYLSYTFRQLPGRIDVYTPNLKSIPNNAFTYAAPIDTFYGPEVTSIGTGAFDMGSDDTHYTPGIRNALFPKCTSIAGEAFDHCYYLTNVVVNATAINNSYSFNMCQRLENLQTAPLTSIGYYSLNHCEKLKHLNLSPTSVSFGEYACRNCYSLEIDSWPASVSVSVWSFSGCRSLKNVNELLGRWTTLATYGVFYGCSGLTELYSDNIASINNYQIFQYCSSVTNISFPNLTAISSVTRASSTFANMASLKHVNMPKLAAVQTGSFDPCQYLFAYDTALEEIEFPSLVQVGTAPNDWYRQSPYMFEGCTKLRRISLPQCKMLFSRSGFKNCVQLKYIEMPALEQFGRDTEGYENYDYGTFVYCRSLESVSFPSLKTLNQVRWTFKQCDSLKNFSAPNLTNIYAGGTTKTLDQMFPQCPALKDVTLGLKSNELLAYPGLASACPYNNNVVWHCPADAPLNVDVMYVNGAWRAVTNGTFRLADYIQGSGAQYINTGYTHKTNTQIEIEFALVPQASPKQYEYVFGARKNSDTVNSFAMLSMWNNAKKFDYMRNSNVQSSEYSLDEETRFKAVCSLQNCDIYNAAGEQIYSIVATGTPNEGVGPLAVFTSNNSTTTGAFSPNTYAAQNMKLYRFTIKEEGETVMDLVPGVVGYGETEVPCLLDACGSWHPLFNAGSGQFSYGSVTNNVPTPGT